MGGAFVPCLNHLLDLVPIYSPTKSRSYTRIPLGVTAEADSYSPGLGMETGLSNLAFPLLNLSNIRSCDREEVDLPGKRQEAEHERKTLEKTNRMEVIKKCPVF